MATRSSAPNRRLEPLPWQSNYLVARSLAVQLRSQVSGRLSGRFNLDVLDVGCGRKPYEPLFTPYSSRYVGVDPVDGPNVDVVAFAESLPFPDDSFDCVLSTQVLEHVEDPARAISEMGRVLRPGGVAFVSTHGTIRYHPGPHDYWRWTHEGLARLFSSSASWQSLDVYPNGGNGTALSYLIGQELGSVLRQAHLIALRGPLVALLNLAGWSADRLFRRVLPERNPDLVANYLVVSVTPPSKAT